MAKKPTRMARKKTPAVENVRDVPEGLGPYPESREDLARLLHNRLGVIIPGAALVDGHHAPLDYLWHAFNESAAGPRDCVVWASRGGGKTFLAALATMLDMVFKEGIQVRLLGGSMEQSRRVLSHLRRLFEHDPLRDLLSGRVSETRVRLVNGSVCEVLAASQTSVRGVRVQKIRCDEVDLFDRELWTAAQLATRSETLRAPDGRAVRVKGAVEAISTMHIPGGLMWDLVQSARAEEPGLHGAEPIRRLFTWGVVDVLERCGDEHVCEGYAAAGRAPCPLLPECGGRAKRRECSAAPAGHVTIADAITLKRRVDTATWRTEMLCLPPRRSDSVYPEFDHERHVVDSPAAPGRDRRGRAGEVERSSSSRFLAGMDFGFRSPTVALLAAVDGESGRPSVVIIDEQIASERRLEDHIAALRARGWPLSETDDPPLSFIAVDPAGLAEHEQTGESNVAVLRRLGLPVRVRRTRVHAGLCRVRAMLDPADGAPPRLRVHRRCRGLIEAMTKYRYAPTPASGEGRARPLKDGSDHACDALRYLVDALWSEGKPMGMREWW